jgi:hypothetical protein
MIIKSCIGRSMISDFSRSFHNHIPYSCKLGLNTLCYFDHSKNSFLFSLGKARYSMRISDLPKNNPWSSSIKKTTSPTVLLFELNLHMNNMRQYNIQYLPIERLCWFITTISSRSLSKICILF